MEIVGHGVDLVELDRVEDLLSRNDDLLTGWFTPNEIVEFGVRAGQADVVGGHIAAKEAVAKALGTGFSGEVSWHDIEVFSDELGAPSVRLSGGALAIAKTRGVLRMLVSISHARTSAIASVIALGATGRD